MLIIIYSSKDNEGAIEGHYRTCRKGSFVAALFLYYQTHQVISTVDEVAEVVKTQTFPTQAILLWTWQGHKREMRFCGCYGGEDEDGCTSGYCVEKVKKERRGKYNNGFSQLQSGLGYSTSTQNFSTLLLSPNPDFAHTLSIISSKRRVKARGNNGK